MIDQELRDMFTEREALAPDAVRVAGQIGVRIRQRQARGRRVRLVTVATAVIGVTVGAAAWATGGANVPLASPGPTSTDRPSGRLVTAADPRLEIPVRATWLPPDLAQPSIFTNAQEGSLLSNRSITYEGDRSRREPGTMSVTILTHTGSPVVDISGNGPNVAGSDIATVDINGHEAERFRMANPSQETRTCTITWQQRPDLKIMVDVLEKSTDATLNCDKGIQVARSVVEQPQELRRTVRLTRVPAGFALVQTGTNLERWCPTSQDAGADCVEVQSTGSYGVALGDPVRVHGHAANLERDDGGFTLVVTDRIRMWSQRSDLTDDEILEMAGMAVLEGGW